MNAAIKTLKWLKSNGICLVYMAIILVYLPVVALFVAQRGFDVGLLVVSGLLACLLAAMIAKIVRGKARIIFLAPLLIAGVVCAVLLPGATGETNEKVILSLTAVIDVVAIMMAIALGYARIRRRDPKGYMRLAILVVLLAPWVYLLHDEPPIENDYVPTDVIATWPGAEEGREVLLTFRKGGKIKPDIQMPNITTSRTLPANILDYAEEIEKGWEEMARSREVISKLNKYDKITDLADPSVLNDFQRGVRTPIMSFVAYRSIARAYWGYAQLRAEQGRHEEGIEALVELHSVAGKGIPNMGTLVGTMIWVAIANADIDRAFKVAQTFGCSDAGLTALREGFRPIPRADVSMRRMLIAEYMWVRSAIASQWQTGQRYHVADVITDPSFSFSKPGNRFMRMLLATACRPNSTLRMLRAYIGAHIELESTFPKDFRQSARGMRKRLGIDSDKPPLRNIGGWYIVAVAWPSYVRASTTCHELHVRSELFTFYLAKRLGENVTGTDPFTGKAFPVDEDGVPFSTGWDAVPNTADDIRLGAL